MPRNNGTRTVAKESSARGHRSRTTIADVARRAGVSIATVSLVLNGRSREMRISPKAEERVLEACRELGYRPNIHARRLVRLRSDTLAFLIGGTGEGRVFHLFGAMLSGVLQAASEHDLRVYLSEWNGSVASEEQYLRWLEEGSVDRLLVYAIAAENLNIEALRAHEVPIIFLDRIEPEWSFITSDHANGSELAVRHLIELGHRHIAFVSGPSGSSPSRERLRGFKAAVCQQLPDEPLRVIPGGFTEQAGYRAGDELLQRYPEVTAVVCAHDYAAYGLIGRLQEEGVNVPEAMSVVGANDTELARLMRPGLTTVRVPMREMAVAAVEALAALPPDGSPAWVQKSLPVELVVRGSTAPPRSSALRR